MERFRAAWEFPIPIICLVLAGVPCRADTLVQPAHMIDSPCESFAEGSQGPVLIAANQDSAIAVYVDQRDGHVHAVVVDGVSSGGSRDSVLLDEAVDLVQADLAASPDEFLLVWEKEGTIWGQRLTLSVEFDEVIVGSVVNVSASAASYSHPTVAFGPSDWLVAFREAQAETGWVTAVFVEIGETGEVGGHHSLAGPDVADFDVAGNSTSYGFSCVSLGTTNQVTVSQLDGDGSVLVTETLSETEVETGTRVAITLSDSMGWSTWFHPGGRLFGRRFSSEDFIPVASEQALTDEDSVVGGANVGLAGEAVWTIWEEEGALFAGHWNEAGLVTSFDLQSTGAAVPVAAEGEDIVMAAYVVTDADTGQDVYTQALSLPFPFPPRLLTAGSAPRQKADLVWMGDESAVAWAALGPGDDQDIYLVRLDAFGLPLDRPPRVVSDGPADETDVALAYAADSGILLVVWVDDYSRLRGRRYLLDESGLVAEEPFDICYQANGVGAVEVERITHESEEFFLLVWRDGRAFETRGWDIAAVRIPASGAFDPDCGVILVEDDEDDVNPQLATDGSTSMTVWSTGFEGFPVVEGVLIDSTGQVGSVFQAPESTHASTEMDLASFGSGQWLLAGSRPDQVSESGADIYLTRFEGEGDLVDVIQVPAVSQEEHDHSPRLLVDGGTVALVWNRGVPPAIRTRQYSYNDNSWVESSEVEVIASTALIGGPLAVAGSGANQITVIAREWDRLSVRGDERLSSRQVITDGGPIAHAGPPQVAVEGDILTFDGDQSIAPAGSSYTWYVVGTEFTGQTVEYPFADDGTFYVRLSVTEPTGDPAPSDTDEIEVRILNQVPEVIILGESFSFLEGEDRLLEVGWNDAGIHDTVALDWSFGDGDTLSGPAETLASVFHTYWQGEYRLCVTAQDKDGAVGRDCREVSATNVSPAVSISSIPPLDEGCEVVISVSIADDGQDPLTIEWDWGDGTLDVDEGMTYPYPSSRTFTYVDDDIEGGAQSPFDLCVTATDDDSSSAGDCIQVVVFNVTPEIAGTAAEIAEEGIGEGGDPLLYEAFFDLIEPGDDDLVVELSTDGLDEVNLEVDLEAMSVYVWFEPTLEQWRSRVPPTWTFELEVDDGDAAGVAFYDWTVTIVPQDENGDGLPDTCAHLYDLSDPGDVDSDGDGLENAEECFYGTDPTVDNRPLSAPSLHAPADGGTVDTLTPTLSVVNVPHDVGVSYEYEFELYDAPALATEDWVDGGLVSEGESSLTRWLPTALIDRQCYYWRCRVTDGLFNGPWMDVALFEVGLPNEDPEVPVLIGPEGDVDTTRPVFSWYNSIDPDSDEVTYKFEVFRNAELTDRERVVSGIIEGDGITEYQPDEDASLQDNTDYYWRVTADDARRGVSDPSEALMIHVDTANDPPPAPTIVAPQPGAVVDTRFPELVVTPVEDEDGDLLTYAFVVSPDESFDNIVDWIRELVPREADGLVHYEVRRQLDENASYYWRSAARDRFGLGYFVQGDFFVDTHNDPPMAPTFQSPSDEQVVTTTTPELVVRNTTDPEGDVLTYDFQVFEDDALTDQVFSAYGVPEGVEDETRVTVDPPLANRMTYYTRARAVDDEGALGSWSETIEFHVQEGSMAPPSAPEPLDPVYGAAVSADDVVLVVVNSRDSSGRTRTYEFEVFRDAGLEDRVYHAEAVSEGEEGTTSHRVSILLGEGQYFWHARADNGEQVGPWSDTWMFEVDQDGPVDRADMGGDSTRPDSTDTAVDEPPGEMGGALEEGCGCVVVDRSFGALGFGLLLMVLAVGRKRFR